MFRERNESDLAHPHSDHMEVIAEILPEPALVAAQLMLRSTGLDVRKALLILARYQGVPLHTGNMFEMTYGTLTQWARHISASKGEYAALPPTFDPFTFMDYTSYTDIQTFLSHPVCTVWVGRDTQEFEDVANLYVTFMLLR